MAAKGSRLSRAIQFFEEAEHREMRAAWIIVKEVVEKRLADAGTMRKLPMVSKPKVSRGRKPKTAAAIHIDDKTLALGTEGAV